MEAAGKVCIGTVKGDLHDIGKNLVKMMMEGKGLEVVDLGTDVAPETYVQTAVEQGCQIICCSALLTTTMGMMEEVVKKAEEAGIRDKVTVSYTHLICKTESFFIHSVFNIEASKNDLLNKKDKFRTMLTAPRAGCGHVPGGSARPEAVSYTHLDITR